MGRSWSYRVTKEIEFNRDVVFAIRECWVKNGARECCAWNAVPDVE